MKIRIIILALCFVTLHVNGQEKPDFNKYGSANVTASRLVGKWTVNPDLTLRLKPTAKPRTDTFEFIVDSTAIKSIPKENLEFVKDKPIYLSGYFIFKNKSHPFLLTESDGNTHLLYFNDKNGVKNADGESFILFIAVSNDKKNDLLLTGGDFNNQPFKAWDRIN